MWLPFRAQTRRSAPTPAVSNCFLGRAFRRSRSPRSPERAARFPPAAAQREEVKLRIDARLDARPPDSVSKEGDVEVPRHKLRARDTAARPLNVHVRPYLSQRVQSRRCATASSLRPLLWHRWLRWNSSPLSLHGPVVNGACSKRRLRLQIFCAHHVVRNLGNVWRHNSPALGGLQIPRWAGGWVLHQPPWSFGFDSQTRGTRENRRTLC